MPLVGLPLSVEPFAFACLGGSLALVGALLALIGALLALVGLTVTLVSGTVAFIGEPLAPGELAVALGACPFARLGVGLLRRFLAMVRAVVPSRAHDVPLLRLSRRNVPRETGPELAGVAA